jgi:hypothetical protein
VLQADAIDFARLWSPKLYIENSLGDPKEQIRHRIIYNEKGEAFIYEKRVAKGTFMENLELDDFPFDVQVNIFYSIITPSHYFPIKKTGQSCITRYVHVILKYCSHVM